MNEVAPFPAADLLNREREAMQYCDLRACRVGKVHVLA